MKRLNIDQLVSDELVRDSNVVNDECNSNESYLELFVDEKDLKEFLDNNAQYISNFHYVYNREDEILSINLFA